MTTPLGPRPYDELPPAIASVSLLRTAAGITIVATAVVTNRAPEPRILAVTALGIDAAWASRPGRSRPVLPGQSMTVEVELTPTTGTLPARYPFALAAQAIDPVTGNATSNAALADVTLVVDAPGQIEVEIEPAETTGLRRRKLTVFLRNTGAGLEQVHLDVQSPETAEVELADEIVEIPPGGRVPVAGRIRIEPRLFGQRQRFTYTVSARGSGAPRRAEAFVTTRAYLGANSSKAFVLMALVILWVGLAVFFVPKLAHSVSDSASTKAASVQAGAASKAAPASGAAQSDVDKHAGAGSGSAKASAGSGGSGGSGSGGSGSGGSGGSGSGGSGAGGAAANTIQLSGTVTGNSPGDVQVAMRPTSLVDEQAQDAHGVGVDTASFQAIGKIPQSALSLAAPLTTAAPTSSNRSLKTHTDGAWSFAAVRNPGYYLLTFAKPGYQTQRYVVDAATTVATNPLKVDLTPGQGKLSGQISGPGGAVGGAQITITDGTNTVTTSSNSAGKIGDWSVDGLSTPSTYLVMASKDGLSTESAIVTLKAGGVATQNLTLRSGDASLVGTVRGPNSLGTIIGLGGVQVTATSGKTVRTATTVTNGDIAGTYILPDLPPGTYTVTTTAPGYLTQTQRVTIRAGQSKVTANALLTASTATVTGVVTGDQLDDSGVPIPGKVSTLDGAGVTLSSDANTYKITTGSDGAFRVNGVAPGTYVVTAQYGGLLNGYATITASAGHTTVVPTFLLIGQQATNDATITGFVGDGANPSGTLCASAPNDCTITFVLHDSQGNTVAISPTEKHPPASVGPTPYTLEGTGKSGIPPGQYQLTVGVTVAAGSAITGYLPATVSVRVPLNGDAVAPQVNLFTASTITGTITSQFDATGGGNYTNCVWAVPDSDANPAPTNCTAPTKSSCTTTGKADRAVGVINRDGSYSIPGLCNGSYAMYIVVTNPDFVAPVVSPRPVVQVSDGSTGPYSGQIFRLGRIQLVLTAADPATGNAAALTDATLTSGSGCGSNDLTGKATDGSGDLLVTGLNANTYTCTIKSTSGGSAVSGTTAATNVTLDGTATVSLTLTAPATAFVGQVTTSWSGSAQPVGSDTVLVSGITGYTNGVANSPQQVSVTTDAAGCFVVSPDGRLPSTVPGACASDPQLSTAVVTLKLAVPRASFHVAAQHGYQVLDQSNVAIDASTVHALSVIPDPVNFSGKLTADPQPADLSGARIEVTKYPLGSTKPTVTSDGDGNLSWITGPSTGQQIVPGIYTIAVTAAGFAPWSYDFTCAPGSDCSQQFALVYLGSLNVTGLPAGAQVTVVANDGTTFGPKAPSGGTAGFTGLLPTSPFQGTRPSYQVQVHAAGYVFDSSVPLDCNGSTSITIAPGATTSCAVTLKADASITGNVQGVTSVGGKQNKGPLPGATVTAQLCSDAIDNGSCTPATGAAAVSFSAVSNDTDGTFTITGSNQTQGLDKGAWLVTATLTGYGSASTAINVDPDVAQPQDAGELDLNITKVDSFSVTVKDGNGATLTTGITVSLLQNNVVIGTPVTSSTGGTYTFTDLYPGLYSVEATGPAIVASTDDDVPIDSTHKTYTKFVTLGASVVSGLVSGPQGKDPGASPLNGATVKIGTGTTVANFAVAPGVDKVNMSTTTPSTGQTAGKYKFTNVPDGTWTVQFSATGYTPQLVTGVVVNHNNAATTLDQPLTRITHKVVLTVTKTDATDDVSGSTGVSLTSTDDPSWTLTPDATAGKAGQPDTWTFGTVPFGSWDVSITLPEDHFGTLTGSNPALGCDGASATSAMTCSSTDTGGAPLVLSAADGATVTPTYNLNEYEISLDVVAKHLATDPNSDPPGVVNLSVSDPGGDKVYANDAFNVSDTLPADPTDSFWGVGGTNYTSTVTTDATNWSAAAITFTPKKPDTVITLQESGASVTVTVTGTFTGQPKITLTPPTGSGITAPAAQTTVGRTITFTDVPYGDGWTASGTRTFTPTGGTATTVTGTATFDVTEPTPDAVPLPLS